MKKLIFLFVILSIVILIRGQSMTIEEALAQAKSEYLGIPGVVGVSRIDDKIIFYVETEADRDKVPSVSYKGFPVEVSVVGKVKIL